MRSVLTGQLAIEARRLSEAGVSLSEITSRLGISPGQRQSVWRAIRRVTTAAERIAAARRTGDYTALTCGEALMALDMGERPFEPPTSEAARD